ncbi:MAG: hypothetical protein RL514_3656 [Verrucomicrobiota bacterium]|jgi:hypothetical protein
MSWIQLHDEVWPVTPDEGEWRVHIHAADVGCPRVSWNLCVSHYLRPKDLPKPKVDRWLDMDVGGLVLEVRDWRRLAGLEIRADAAWHATHEFIGPYGHCYNSPRVTVHQTILRSHAEREGVEAGRTAWIAHDFTLRLGTRDGWSFPCELDAWLIPEAEYYRTQPEAPEVVARFPEGPPNFRLVTRATFVQGTVELTRAAAADPEHHAREVLRTEIACETMRRPEVKWMLRQTPEREAIVPMPGWRSDVHFYTPPGSAPFEKAAGG